MSKVDSVTVETPLGVVRIAGTEAAITALDWVEAVSIGAGSSTLLQEAAGQLVAYFRGERTVFDLPLAPAGTLFQQRVWAEVARVPFGQVVSYQDVANALGNPKATRAVGAANGRNPISIIIPCHRVIGHDGGLVGYGGGLWRKEWLLRHEGVLLV